MVVAFPCGVCSGSIGINHRAIECSICSQWVHLKCNKLDSKDYAFFQKSGNENEVFICINCIADNTPFSNLNNNEFSVLVKNGIIDSNNCRVNFTPTDFHKTIIDKLNYAINNNAFDLDTDDKEENEGAPIPTINCQYYNLDEFHKSKFNPSKNFSILHYNIHSIQLHIEEFRVALQMLDFPFDVICISESKIIKDFEPIVDISLPGFHAPISTPTESTKGGVLIYVNKNLNFKPRDDLNIYKSSELESSFIEIINTNDTNDIVGVIYRHPSMNPVEFIDDYLNKITDKISKENKKIFIAGDFNFNLLNTSTHPETFDFFDTMMSNFLLPVITIPTKINRDNNTLIDNIFTNHLNPDTVSGNLTLNLSDGHLPSFMIMPKNNQNHQPKKHNIYTRCSKNFDSSAFLDDYHKKNWDFVIDTDKNDVNFSLNQFFSNMNTLLDTHLPLRKVSKKEFKQKFKPWVSNVILTKISDKNKAFKRYLKAKVPSTKSDHLKTYKSLKNEITLLMRAGKKEYYKKYFSTNKNNIQKIWKGIKEIINIKSKNYDYPTCLQDGDVTITDPLAISNSFNSYFTSIADNILKKRKYEGSKSFRDFLANRLTESFIFQDCTENEIKTIISSFSVSTSSGPNSIPTKILLLLKDHICQPLHKIFNLSLRVGQHPDILKVSKTIPIFKKGSRLLVSNYRPISLLSNINKILEKIVHGQVYSFLEDSHCIYSFQFGFRKKHSTNHALIEITETIRQALDNKNFACGIFVDLQKAFDTVNHDILISKLDHYGIRGPANDWFSSYLKDRTQFVSILGFESDTKKILHGVPQGSVLGPLLFLIYINDLHFSIKNSKVFHFADDTNLLNIGKSPKSMQKQINADLKILYNWLLANKISLNSDKTEIIFFHKPGEKIPDLLIKMNGHRIFPSKYIKYLGVYLDETLNWGSHCCTLSKKLKRANGMLCKARHFVPKDELKTLYYAIFSSHLTYGSQIWGQVTTSFNHNIFKLQNRALRIITFSDFRANSSPLYIDLKVLKLRDHITIQNCLFVHDSLKNISPKCFCAYFNLAKNVHSFCTKSNSLGCLFVPKSTTIRYGIYSITNKCISNWNAFTKALQLNLINISRSNLKIKLTRHLLDSYN